MKKLLLLVPVLLLTGCLEDVPVTSKWPAIPDDLKAACPALKEVDPGTTKLSDVIGVVSENYGQYHECQVKIDSWIEWYNTQKKIQDEIK